MTSDNETIEEIAKEMRTITFGEERCPDCGADFQRSNQWPKFADRIEAAHMREITELKNKCEEYERQPELMAETARAALELLKAQESKIAELSKCLKEACRYRCGKCNVGNFETESHFCGNYCDTIKRWHKALEGANNGNQHE